MAMDFPDVFVAERQANFLAQRRQDGKERESGNQYRKSQLQPTRSASVQDTDPAITDALTTGTSAETTFTASSQPVQQRTSKRRWDGGNKSDGKGQKNDQEMISTFIGASLRAFREQTEKAVTDSQTSSTATTKPSTRKRDPKALCFNCRQPGHFRTECPKPPRRNERDNREGNNGSSKHNDRADRHDNRDSNQDRDRSQSPTQKSVRSENK